VTRLELLILIRLSTNKSLRRSGLARELRALMEVDDLDKAIRALVAGRWLSPRPLGITATGRARVAEALGAGKPPTWREIRARYLPAMALGVSPPAATDVTSAVVAQVLVRLLGLSPRSTDPARVFLEAISKVMGDEVADETALQAALLRRWISERPVLPSSEPPRPPPPAMPPKTWTDDDVVVAVRSATARVPAAGRFGDERVFVSAIWRQLGEGAAFPGLTLDGLKSRLVAANRRQQLTLARADLVGAMDPREVATSEIRYLNSTFHFVLDRSRS
jgi:hypothetical protein